MRKEQQPTAGSNPQTSSTEHALAIAGSALAAAVVSAKMGVVEASHPQ